jgi:hypothetical protein
MKSGPALWCVFTLLLGSFISPGFETAAAAAVPFPADPSLTADDQFFVDHPDLKDEAGVVKQAAADLASEGYQPETASQASDALAAKCRAILAARRPHEWQQKAVSLFPALGVAGSDFNLLFLKHYHELRASTPAFTQEPSWPVLLAKRCDEELRAAHPAASESTPAPASAAKPAAKRQEKPVVAAKATPSEAPAAIPLDADPDGRNSVHQERRSRNFWQTFFALLLLVILTSAPGVFAFRPAVFVLRKPELHQETATEAASAPEVAPEPKRDPPIWRTALKHAAILYVVTALPSAVYTFMSDFDLGVFDQLFVSFLVGSLFGLFITLPFYGIERLWQACQKHPVRPATR